MSADRTRSIRSAATVVIAVAASIVVAPAAFASAGAVTEAYGGSWSAVTDGSNIPTLRAVAFGGGKFVAVGSPLAGNPVNRSIATSTDGGASWTVRTAPNANVLTSVAYGGGVFVASSTAGALVTSSDGTSWSSTAGVTSSVRKIAYGNGRFVAVGDSGAVESSTDGTSWSLGAGTTGSANWTQVAYGNGRFVVFAASGKTILTSTDGITWSSADISVPGPPAVNLNGAGALTYGGGKFLALSLNKAWTSTDGLSWSVATTSPSGSNPWADVVYSGGTYIAALGSGAQRAATSSDGVTWTLQTTPLSPLVTPISIAAGSGRAVIVGSTAGTVYLSASSIAATLSTGSDPIPVKNPTTGTIKGSGWGLTDGTPVTSTSFQWQRCYLLNDNTSCTDITESGATGAWWGTRDADIGYQVRLKTAITAAAGVVNAWSALSGLIGVYGVTAPTLSTQTPKVGKNISSTFGVWQGYVAGTTTAAYQWQACTSKTDSATCSDIAGAPNAANYKPTAGQSVTGKYLRVSMTLTTRGQSAVQSSAITSSPVAA